MAQIPHTSAPAQTTSTVLAGQQPLDHLGGANLDLPVRMVWTPRDNEDASKPYIIRFANTQYHVQPNVPTYIPYLAMVMVLGDPRAIDVQGGKPHQQFRRLEVERLRVHWGVYEYDDRWANLPDLKAYPIDSDVPFNTVLDDPDGVNMNEQQGGGNQAAFLAQQLEQQTRALQVLQGQMAVLQSAADAREAAGLDPDEPLEAALTTSKSVAPESMVSGPTPARSKSKVRVPDDGAQDTVTKDGPVGVGS